MLGLEKNAKELLIVATFVLLQLKKHTKLLRRILEVIVAQVVTMLVSLLLKIWEVFTQVRALTIFGLNLILLYGHLKSLIPQVVAVDA
jgi:hypothetical protein